MAALKLSGLDGRTLEACMEPGALVLFPAKMTALELAMAVDSLLKISGDLISHLSNLCDECDDCGDCGDTPCQWRGGQLRVPAWAREAAGIPGDAKLDCFAMDEIGEIRVTQADYRYDLSDLPSRVLQALTELGVCMEDLNALIKTEEIVYGE